MFKRKMKLKAVCFSPTSRAIGMSNAPRGEYQSISVMDERTVPGSKFFIEVAGITNGAHRKIVSDIKNRGYVDVSSPQESDFVLIFCPVVSRVGTDIGEALQNVTQTNKRKLLVVMHHTFNDRQAVADSRRQVEDGNVDLTVDYLFYEGNILDCERNNIAWGQICKYLPDQTSWLSPITSIGNWCCRHPKRAVCAAVAVTAAVITVIIIVNLG